MFRNTPTPAAPRSNVWTHPMLWKMVAIDVLLIGFTGMTFSALSGGRVAVVLAAIILASLVLNRVLVPPATELLPTGTHAASTSAPPGDAGAAVVATPPVQSVTLIRRSLQAHEVERAAIAGQLRATAAQQLAALMLQLAAAANATEDEAVVTPLTAARLLAGEAATDIAALAEQIAPAWRGEFGLVPALDALHHRISERGLVGCDFRLRGDLFPLELPVTRAMLRVAEAAVDNVERHANARLVTMDVSFDSPVVRLEIADDAQGFDLALLERGDGGLGLFRARELLAHVGGAMQIESAPGWGTRVLATVDTSREAAA